MKYQLIQLLSDPPQHSIQVGNANQFFHVKNTPESASHLCGELNRLDAEIKRLKECLRPKVEFFGGSHPKRHEGVTVDGKRYLLESIVEEDLAVQVEAKNNALRKVEALGVELERKLRGTPTNQALKQRLGIRTGQVSRLLDVLERAQTALALYIDPGATLKPKAVLTDLMGILDDGELVKLMRNLRELIGVKDNGSVELTKDQKNQVLTALDNIAMLYPGFWPESMAKNYDKACRILGASEDGDVSPHVNCRSTTTELPLSIGDEVLVTLKRMPDGKQYLSGLGVGLQYCACVPGNPPFIVQADKIYVNDACIDKLTSTISKTQLGEAIHEGFERVVNNTTNNFVPEYRLRRKERAALESAINKLEENPGDIGLTPDEEAAQRLRKLLKKLS